MPPEIVLNGAKLWTGTLIEYDDEKGFVLVLPSGALQEVKHGELAVDGVVISGPHAGMYREERQLDRGRSGPLLKTMYHTGWHGVFCERTDDGWICREGCSVADEPVTPTFKRVVDSLDSVEKTIERLRFRVYWSLDRVSTRYVFINGRCRIPGSTTALRSRWHSGVAWTKRGARKQMKRFEP